MARLLVVDIQESFPLRIAEPIRQAVAPRIEIERRVLVVEDNDVSRTVVRHMLAPRGYPVDCAATGAEAIEKASRGVYFAILMDLQLPDMSGIDVTRAIRQFPHHAETPIIAFTANTADEYRTLCRKEGMQGFLGKPVNLQELMAALSRLVR